MRKSDVRVFAVCFAFGLLCMLVGGACSAHADDGARLGWFEPIARAAWPGSPCAGREVVHLEADALLAAEAPYYGALAARYGLNGLAQPSTCEVWLHSGMPPIQFCVTLTHEFGHLSGRGHTTIPGDVMNGEGDIQWTPCDLAVARAARRGRSRWAIAHRSRSRRPSYHPDPAPT